jgi:penicillin-binding protein 2
MISPVSKSRILILFLTFSLASFVSGAVRSKAKKVPSTTKRTVPVKSGTRSRTVAKPRAIGSTRSRTVVKKKIAAVASSRAKSRIASSARSKRRYRPGNSNYVAGGPWAEPTFADSTAGDNIDGEDLIVRRAAVEALGAYNGSVVVADPQTGRLLTVVNQKVAFKNGFQPCSTIKIVAAVAGLHEGVIDRSTHMRLYGRTTINLTDALARSNNPYFANIGVKLGYEKVAYYSRLLGLGEKAGYNIEEEEAGTIPDAPPRNGGMGMMTSFGEGIKLTPLQLTAVLTSIANGGTLYYLQYPKTQAEAVNLVPRVKRQLAIQDTIPDMKPGLQGAVEYGTARRAGYDPNEPIFGKTGTCTDRATPTHLGWFGSFNEVAGRKLVVVVLLTGGRPVNGPVAAGVAGAVYRNLSQQQFFAKTRTVSPVAIVSGSSW